MARRVMNPRPRNIWGSFPHLKLLFLEEVSWKVFHKCLKYIIQRQSLLPPLGSWLFCSLCGHQACASAHGWHRTGCNPLTPVLRKGLTVSGDRRHGPTCLKGTPCMCVCTRACVLVAQSCLILCNTMDCSPSGSSVHGILQARTLE